jgi:hypothetical protein
MGSPLQSAVRRSGRSAIIGRGSALAVGIEVTGGAAAFGPRRLDWMDGCGRDDRGAKQTLHWSPMREKLHKPAATKYGSCQTWVGCLSAKNAGSWRQGCGVFVRAMIQGV